MTIKNIPLLEIREWKMAHVVTTSSIRGLSLVGQWVLGWVALPLQGKSLPTSSSMATSESSVGEHFSGGYLTIFLRDPKCLPKYLLSECLNKYQHTVELVRVICLNYWLAKYLSLPLLCQRSTPQGKLQYCILRFF